MASTSVPPEIWLRIAQFIPSGDLQKLYSVNPVFLDLALDAKYSKIRFDSLWCPGLGLTMPLGHLNQAHVGHRVRQLTLLTDWLSWNTYRSPVGKITCWMMMAWCMPFDLGRFLDSTVSRLHELKKCDRFLERTVLNFPNISSLNIIMKVGASSQPSQVVLNAFTACASSLRKLSLTAESPNFDAIFPPNASELTSLEEVTFTVYSWPCISIRSNGKAASKFFQTISSRLTTLNVSFRGTADEPSCLLQSFQATFPKLKSLSLSHSRLPPGPRSDLLQFLNHHAGTLKHLRLQHSDPSVYASRSLDGLGLSPALPHLETLDILKSDSFGTRKELASPEGLEAVRAYVRHSRTTLTSLCLTHCFFTLHDLGILLDLLGQGSSENPDKRNLKNLTVAVEVLSPQVLDMLAAKSPQLETLILVFAHIRGNDSADVPPWNSGGRDTLARLNDKEIESFLLAMKTRSYPRWRLRTFGINRVWLIPPVALSILVPLAMCCLRESGEIIRMWGDSPSPGTGIHENIHSHTEGWSRV